MVTLKEGPKDNIFPGKRSIRCGSRLLDLDQPLIMGIFNATPDSFFDGGKYKEEEEIIKRVEKMIRDGADIIDVGGYSSRPGATDIPELTELERVIPVVKLLHEHFPELIISIDTFRSKVARKAIEHGASIINDISGGALGENMFDTVAELQVPYILMHMKGTPQTMQEQPEYTDVTDEIFQYFSEKTDQLYRKGVNDIILDPGFGFGKTLEDNYRLLARMDQFGLFNLPVLAGVSRKSMVNKVLSVKPGQALNGTTVINTLALLQGAAILRVHDVKEAKEAAKIVNYYQKR